MAFGLSILFTIIVTTASSLHRHHRGRCAGVFWRFDRFVVSAVYRNLERCALALRDHHHVCDSGAKLSGLLVFTGLFGWMGLVGVVRAEFLRARNLEYVRAAGRLGVGNWTIMFRHMLPNAMVATLTHAAIYRHRDHWRLGQP